MRKAEQGDILKVVSMPYPFVVVSKNFFNDSGMVMACPIIPNAVPGPLRIRCNSAACSGYIYCEQVRLVDLNARRFSKVSSVPYGDLIDVVDAIQGIFDYV